MFLRLFIVALLLSLPQFAVASDEVQTAKNELQEMIDLCERIKPYIERKDIGRFLVIQRSMHDVSDLLNSEGLGSLKTVRGYEFMLITVRHSMAFFNEVQTTYTSGMLKKIIQTNEAIAVRIDFDEDGSPATRITATVFSQMHKLLLQLRTLPGVPDDIRLEAESLIAPVGNVIAIARKGDRPKTYEAAIPLQKKITSLYPVFEKIVSSHAAFNLVYEIRGLNEWYGEFAQVNE